jgi:putative DNA primase/helicase
MIKIQHLQINIERSLTPMNTIDNALISELGDTKAENNSNNVPFFDDDTENMSIDARNNTAPDTVNSLTKTITKEYIRGLDAKNLPAPQIIERELISRVNSAITLENIQIPVIPVGKDKNGNIKYIKERDRWNSVSRLLPVQIVYLIMAFHNILRIDTAEDGVESEEDLLGIYIDDPNHTNYGLYDINNSTLFELAQQYDYQITKIKFEEVHYILQAKAPRKPRCNERDLIAVNNGIFNYATKKLEPFSPKKVFLTKSKVNYIDNAVNPIIVNDIDSTSWDVESWMQTLSDDKEIVDLFWQTLSCIIRPYVRWNKSVWLYSTVGNNGKGTLCHLMRSLCGNGSHTSIPLADFNKDFALQPLLHANAIIVDENNVGEYIEKSASLKAVVTNDIIQINRKFQRAISFRFWGFMVQCVNELPRIKDKTDSFYRRQILVPMEKCFTGQERTYIKDDYLNRPQVLEYVLWRVLNQSAFYDIEPPAKCKDLLGSYKNSNDPVRDFFNEFSERFVWNLLPIDFLYDLFIAWYKRFNPTGKPEGRNTFKNQLEQVISNDKNSSWKVTPSAVRTTNKMSASEPLIIEYNLVNWKNTNYIGKDPNQICVPVVGDLARGIVRRAVKTANATIN